MIIAAVAATALIMVAFFGTREKKRQKRWQEQLDQLQRTYLFVDRQQLLEQRDISTAGAECSCGHCAGRLKVTEEAALLINLAYPNQNEIRLLKKTNDLNPHQLKALNWNCMEYTFPFNVPVIAQTAIRRWMDDIHLTADYYRWTAPNVFEIWNEQSGLELNNQSAREQANHMLAACRRELQMPGLYVFNPKLGTIAPPVDIEPAALPES